MSAIQRLIERFARLPGIGKRSAERMAYYLLRESVEEAELLAAAIVDLKRHMKSCSVCGNVTESDPCPICGDPNRDHRVVMVVEQPGDVAAFEATGQFKGVYHVLMGRLAPLDGIGPGELNIVGLFERVTGHNGPVSDRAAAADQRSIEEVILGTNPTLEGDGTALFLARELGRLGVKVSRLARGLPTGSNLDVISKAVLTDAIQGRQPM